MISTEDVVSPSCLRVLFAFHKMFVNKGYAPSTREIQNEMNWKSPGHVGSCLRRLKHLGLLVGEDFKCRALCPNFQVEIVGS